MAKPERLPPMHERRGIIPDIMCAFSGNPVGIGWSGC
jgi:hypothetical protein